jgi:hypothetical protein
MHVRSQTLLWLVTSAWLCTACGGETSEGAADVGAEEETTRPGLGDPDASEGSEDETDDASAPADGTGSGTEDTSTEADSGADSGAPDADPADVADDTDAPVDADASGPADTSTPDTTPDTSVPDTTPEETGGSLTPLDPALSVPPRGSEPCETPGSFGECSGIAVCRLYAAEESRCESCETCGNLNASCSASNECDILFTCYLGRCTAMCSFETPQTCGNPSDCVDVGHPTYGVCLPF